jgi:type VI secretion system protein VasD
MPTNKLAVTMSTAAHARTVVRLHALFLAHALMRWQGALALLALSLSGLDGCKSPPPPPPPTAVKAAVVAFAGINPDSGGRPSPVVVRVYELKTCSKFTNAEFFKLFDHDQDALGGDIAGPTQEFHVRPGDTLPYDRKLQPDTKAIAVMAGYREMESSRWRDCIDVSANTTTQLSIEIGARDVRIKKSAH